MQRAVFFLLTLLIAAPALCQDAPRDKRLNKPTDYNGRYESDDAKAPPQTFSWTPPATKQAWTPRRDQVRKQLLVANGLWPMPEKTNPSDAGRLTGARPDDIRRRDSPAAKASSWSTSSGLEEPTTVRRWAPWPLRKAAL